MIINPVPPPEPEVVKPDKPAKAERIRLLRPQHHTLNLAALITPENPDKDKEEPENVESPPKS